jgi:hypothetical protein
MERTEGIAPDTLAPVAGVGLEPVLKLQPVRTSAHASSDHRRPDWIGRQETPDAAGQINASPSYPYYAIDPGFVTIGFIEDVPARRGACRKA